MIQAVQRSADVQDDIFTAACLHERSPRAREAEVIVDVTNATNGVLIPARLHKMLNLVAY